MNQRLEAYRSTQGRSHHYAQKPGFLPGSPAATCVLLWKNPVSIHPRLGPVKDRSIQYRSQPTIILASAASLLPSKQQPPSELDRAQPPQNQEF
jgi:hypothetical protein